MAHMVICPEGCGVKKFFTKQKDTTPPDAMKPFS